MRYLRLSFLFFGFAFLITSCQKELSYEAGLGKGTLKKDATGECLPVTVNGSYRKDTLLKPTVNFVDIQVNVAEVGSYAMRTDTVNGYSFSAAGVFAVQGLNTVRLIGSGKPLAPNFDVFTVKFDTSICQFNVTVTGVGGGGGGTSAVFTLAGSPTTCSGAMQSNNFFASLPTTANNYVDVKVDVTTAGTYTITAPIVNGVSFSSTGNLAVGTNQNIRLLAAGTPTAAGTFQYALSTTAPASNCGFSLVVQAAPTAATYTFDCSTPQFFGTYQAGASTAGDSVIIKVISTTGGSYSITSTTANNVSFSGSGVLAASPNPQNVTLLASAGPATASGSFTYTITGAGGTGTCSCTQTFGGTPPVVSTDSIVASIDNVYTTFKIRDTALLDNTSLPGYAAIVIFGESNTAGDEAIGLAVAKLGTSVTPGIYTVNLFPAAFVGASYSNTTTDYIAQSDINFPPAIQTPGFTITITSITATRVIGTFSGRVSDNDGAGPGFKTISGGKFSVTIYP